MPEHSRVRRHEVILEILSCVMVADRQASGAEKQQIHNLLQADDSSWTKAEVDTRLQHLFERIRSQGFQETLDQVCEWARTLNLAADDIEQLLQDCEQLAQSDSEFHDREQQVIRRIRKSLQQLKLPRTRSHNMWKPRPASDDRSRSKSSQPSPLKLLGGLFSGIIGSLFLVLEISSCLSFREQESRFEQVVPGMKVDAVIELMGPAPIKPSGEAGLIVNGMRVDFPAAKQRTVMQWGTLYPKYNHECCYTVYFGDGVVQYKWAEYGSINRD